jgi:hypothetical protein
MEIFSNNCSLPLLSSIHLKRPPSCILGSFIREVVQILTSTTTTRAVHSGGGGGGGGRGVNCDF